MSNYQYRIFVDRNGEVDYIRKQLSSSTRLTSPVTRDKNVIQVDNVLDLFGGDLSDVVVRTYVRNIKIQPLSITAIADGFSRVFLFPEFWVGNTIQVTVDGTPSTDYVLDANRVRFDFSPSVGQVITVSTSIERLLFPPLLVSPVVFRNAATLVEDVDYSIVQTDRSTTIEFPAPLDINDTITLSVDYNKSGPSVAWINNERIVFYGVDIDNNLLLQCQRGSETTAAQDHGVFTVVFDGQFPAIGIPPIWNNQIDSVEVDGVVIDPSDYQLDSQGGIFSLTFNDPPPAGSLIQVFADLSQVEIKVWDGSDRQSLLKEAEDPSSLFTAADVRSFPWSAPIVNFLSS